MNKAPLTDHDLGIPHGAFSNEAKFRDIRKKAKLDEEDRHKKFKRSKKKDREKIPKYKIGEEVVLTGGGYSKRDYYLVEVLDFEPQGDDFNYFGILKKTTDSDKMGRIGRLLMFEAFSFWSRHYTPANVENKGIHWLLDDRTV